WNPRNVSTAGTGGANYLEKGKEISIPYEQLFENNKKIKVEGLGNLAYYPNRDSLHYLGLYDIPEVKTFIRATLRHPAFCKGWDAIIRLGLTNQDNHIDTTGKTYAGWIGEVSGHQNGTSLSEHIRARYNIADEKIM